MPLIHWCGELPCIATSIVDVRLSAAHFALHPAGGEQRREVEPAAVELSAMAGGLPRVASIETEPAIVPP